jgi:hypothetical protein
MVNQDQLASLTCREIIEKRGQIFDDFQALFQQYTKYLFLPDVNILNMLESSGKNDDVIIISF